MSNFSDRFFDRFLNPLITMIAAGIVTGVVLFAISGVNNRLDVIDASINEIITELKAD